MSELSQQQRRALHGDEYAREFGNERQRSRVARLVDHMPLSPGAMVLDAGCGTGLLAELLASRYGTYTGVDFSPAMVEEARRRAVQYALQNCEFICIDLVEHMQATPSAYDAVFMLDISEHVPDPEWATIVDAAHGALKPGGKLYLHTPNLDFFVERFKAKGWMRQFPEHIAVRNAADNSQFFHQAGFSSVECGLLPHYNSLRWLHVLTGLPVVGRFFGARLWVEAVK